MVLARFTDPMKIILQLSADVIGHMMAHLLQHFSGKPVSRCEVFRVTRRANPSERSEAVVEEQRSHDVLNVGGVSELSVFLENVGAGSAGLQQEGVAIVEEVHALCCQLVDSGNLTAK